MTAQGRNQIFVLICVIMALGMIFCAWLVPIHLRAVDIAVINAAGKKRVRRAAVPVRPLPPGLDSGPQSVTPFLIHRDARQKALTFLAQSHSPAVRELLLCRALTNTVFFPPSKSSAGQAFDAAVVICGLLLDTGNLNPSLSEAIESRASSANQSHGSAPLEGILMDELSLGERFDWPHLATFNSQIQSPEVLEVLANAARNAGARLPVLYSAVEMSQSPAAVAQYMSAFSATGLNDLATAEHSGAGALEELLRRSQRIYASPTLERVVACPPMSYFFRAATEYALRLPWLAWVIKGFFYLSAGFVLTMALQPAGWRVPGGEGPRPFPMVFARELLVGCAVLLAALLLTEPYLNAGTDPGFTPFRLRLSVVGGAIASQINHTKESFMNTPNMTASLLTLAFFFVLQALIYSACLARLRETLRQNVPARVKLKLLENEDHLFDAGLYLGFVGTIICLILVSLGILQFSLMAAYSSTSFGIIFVSVLKIFNVRPAKRRLLLEAEMGNPPAPTTPLPGQTLATAP